MSLCLACAGNDATDEWPYCDGCPPPDCDACGDPITADEWPNRHLDRWADTVHARCCLLCTSGPPQGAAK